MRFWILLFYCPVFLYADPLLLEKYDFYSVAAESKSELFNSLKRSSPIRSEGKTYFGLTNATFKWAFRWSTTKGVCAIEQVSVKVDIQYTYPKLITSNQELTKIWNLWFPRLVLHENGHRDIAIQLAEYLEENLNSIPSSSNCSDIKRRGNEVANRYVEQLNRVFREYDRETGHGDTQGATLGDYL